MAEAAPAFSRGVSILAAAKPLLADWRAALATAGRPGADIPKRFLEAYLTQGVLSALFSGPRADDILLKGATSWTAWTSESGIPTFAAQVAAAAGAAGDLELGLRAPTGDDAAVAARPTKDVDFQLSGWDDPEEFVAYFRERVGAQDFAAATGIVLGDFSADARRNIAGRGVVIRGDATIGSTRVRFKVEAFISPFPATGIGRRPATVAPALAAVAERAVVERLLRHAGWERETVADWLRRPGHLRDKTSALADEMSEAGDRRLADWLRTNVLERWGALIAPIPVQVVTPEFMLAEKLTATYDDGGLLSGLGNVRHKDYYDADVILRLATEARFRDSFLPALNPDMDFAPERVRRAFEHTFAVRGLTPPRSLADLPGLSDAYADQMTAEGRTNAETYEQLAVGYRGGREAVPGRDRTLPEILTFVRRQIEALGLLPDVAATVAP